MSDDAWLLQHASNVYSQAGEDGILGKVLDTLVERTGWCVEFGAWDGLHFSNTAHLIRSRGYKAVMIEASAERFKELQRTYADNPGVHPVCAFVGFTPTDNLDTILERTPIPKTFDLLSIDIDGNDYHVWAATTAYQPLCVIIEYNPTIPHGVEFIQAKDPKVMHGASLDSLVSLGKEKGYELVAATRYNGIFVRRDQFAAFGIRDNSVARLRRDQSRVTHVFSGYDGTVFVRGWGALPWHDVPYGESLIQPLPRFLREWRENYGPVRSKVFGLYRRARKLLAGPIVRDAEEPRGDR